MDVLGEGIKAVAVGVSGSKPIPDNLVDPLIRVRVGHVSMCCTVLVMLVQHDCFDQRVPVYS